LVLHERSLRLREFFYSGPIKIGDLFMHYSTFRSSVFFSAGLTMGFVLAAVTISGCGSKPTGQRETVAEDGADDESADGAAAEEAPKPKKAGKGKKGGKGGETAHIGEIPKDVWPEVWLKNPLAVAAEKSPAGVAEPPAVASADAGTKPAPTESAADPVKPAPTAAKSGGPDWASLITGEILADESKAIKNKLTAQLQDPGRYNSTYKEMRVDASTLVVLAAIAPEVPESPSWKTNSKYIRDVASGIAADSTANGDKFYKKAKAGYDKLEALLSGNKPPDVGDAAEKVNFSEVADRRYLMLRMERTKNWMKSDVNSEAVFKKESARLTQEGSLLAIFGKVIATPDYSDHDLDEYKGYAEAVSDAGRAVVTAVKDGDFKAYIASLDACMKACDKCHGQFKNN
jgi:hypothetical protein